MKHLSPFIILLFLAAISVSAQTKNGFKISGEVVDTTSMSPIGYSTVIVSDSTAKTIAATYTNGRGLFTLDIPIAGGYTVDVSAFDYGSKKQKITISSSNIDLGKIALRKGVELSVKEIKVIGQKQLVAISPDKISYNMELDPESFTSTTLEIMRKIPMLSVDGSDNVKLNGESNYKVLVNGRSSAMMSNNFSEVVKSMPASSIQNIEIITNPSTKYDAEGLGGIINIITKRNIPKGVNGSLNAGASSTGTVNGGGYITGRVGKFYGAVNLSASSYKMKGGDEFSETYNYRSDKYRYLQTNGGAGTTTNNMYNLSLDITYEIDTMNLISLSGWGAINDFKGKTNNNLKYWSDAGSLTREYNNLRDNSGRRGSLSGNINYQHSFKKPERIMTISYSIDNTPNRTTFESLIEGVIDYDTYLKYSNNKAYETEHTAQIDYYDPTNKTHQYEVGGKYVLRRNRSNSVQQYYDYIAQQWIDDSDNLNDIDYDQHIGSIYGGYTFNHKSLSVKVGVRGEFSENKGVSKISDEDIPFSSSPEFKVTPYANLTYAFKKNNNLTLSYTQRIQRPGIGYLNPYVNDADPMNIRTGNPDLKSVMSNQASIRYSKSSKKWNLFAEAGVSITKRSIESVTRTYSDGVKFTTFDNIGENNKYRLNVSYSYRLGAKFSAYVNGNVSYVDIKAKSENLYNSGVTYMAVLGGVVALWKEANANFNGGVYSPSINLQGKGSIMYNHSLGLSQRLFKRALTLTLSVSNPFQWNYNMENTMSDEYFSTYSSYCYPRGTVNFGIRYSFGKNSTQMKYTTRSISNDDQLKL